MSDKLLIEIEMSNGDTVEAARALIYLANELFQYSPVQITEPVEWQQTSSDDYRLKWRFSEDALSSWEVSICADLAVQISQVLGNAQDALKQQENHTLTDTLAAIERFVRRSQNRSSGQNQTSNYSALLEIARAD